MNKDKIKALFEKFDFKKDWSGIAIFIGLILISAWFVRVMFGSEEDAVKETMVVTKIVRVIGVDGKVIDIHEYNKRRHLKELQALRKVKLKEHEKEAQN